MRTEPCNVCLGTKKVFNGTDFDICTHCDDQGNIYVEEESDYLDDEYINEDISYPEEWEEFDENKHSSESDSL